MRLVFQAAVGTLYVAIDPPVFDDVSRLADGTRCVCLLWRALIVVVGILGHIVVGKTGQKTWFCSGGKTRSICAQT